MTTDGTFNNIIFEIKLTIMKTPFPLLLIFIILFVTHSNAQSVTNYSGLKNVDLKNVVCSADDLQNQIRSELPGSGLPAWGPDQMHGASKSQNAMVDRLSIIEDRAAEIKGEIYYSGFEGGTITVVCLSSGGNEQKESGSLKININNTSGMVEFDMKLPSNLVENAYLKSSYLRIIYSPGSHSKDRIFCFEFPKRWRVLPNNENIVITLHAIPFNTAKEITTYSTSLPAPHSKQNNGIVSSPSASVSPAENGEGPSNNRLDFFKVMLSDYNFTTPREISDIALDQIYSDLRETSGKYYFKPAAYSLSWNPESGFNFNMLYGGGTVTGDGQVNMSAKLSSNITINEFAFVRELLSKYLKGQGKNFNDLILLDPDEPKVSIKDNLARFNIPPDKFAINVSSSVYEPIDLAWTATKDATDFMITALGMNSDIGGEMTYRTSGGSINYQIPLKLMIADKSTFGRFELLPETWRNNIWQNQTPFSVRIKNMHIMVMNNVAGKILPCIYTWQLGNVVIPSKSKIKFDALLVPQWIDQKDKVLRMWMEYEVMPCQECTQEIVDQISSGTSSGREKFIKFHSMGLLQAYGVQFLKIKVRSKYLDPRGKATLEKTITIERDRQDYKFGPFYVWNEKDLVLQYKMSMVSDERTYEGVSWLTSKDLEIYMNKTTAEQSLGSNLPKTAK